MRASCSQVLLSRLAPSGVAFLRLLRDFFGVAFSFEEVAQRSIADEAQEDEEETCATMDLSWAPLLRLTCVGTGFKNLGLSSF